MAGQGEVVILAEGAGAQGDGLGPGQGGEAQTLSLTARVGGAFMVFLAEDISTGLQMVER